MPDFAQFEHLMSINFVLMSFKGCCIVSRSKTHSRPTVLVHTQEAVTRSLHDWKIVEWDVKPQHKPMPTYISRTVRKAAFLTQTQFSTN